METSFSLRNCHTLPVPRQSRGFSRINKFIGKEGSVTEHMHFDVDVALVVPRTRWNGLDF